MIDLFWIGFGLLGAWFLGVAAALLIFGSRLLAMPVERTGFLVARAEVVGLGCVLGITVTSYLQFLWSLAGGMLGRRCSVFFAIGGLVLGILAWWKASRRNHQIPIEPKDLLPGSHGTQLKSARFCVVVVVLIFMFAAVQTLLTPQKFWDERAYYGLKAIVLFEDRTIYSSDLAEPDFIQGHPKYPLMISLAEQHLYALLGRVDDRWSKIIFPVLYFGLVLVWGGVLSHHRNPNTAWFGALMLASMPVLMPDDYGFICGQADAPVACLEGLAVLYACDALSGRSQNFNSQTCWLPSLIMSGLIAGLAGFTKDEGISYCAIHVMALVIVLIAGRFTGRHSSASESADGKERDRQAWRGIGARAITLAAAPALLLAPWFWHRSHLPLTGEMNYFGRLNRTAILSGIGTLTWSIPHLAERMFLEATIWGLQWWLLIVMFVFFPRRALRPAQLFLILNLAGALGALLLAGMVAPITFHEHIGGSSHRYLMQIAPTALLFSLGQFAATAELQNTNSP